MNLAGKRVLLVEDEPIIGFALEDMIADAGGVTTFARTLDEGMKAACDGTFDAAIIDVNLHGSDSGPIACELIARDVAVVFATGYGSVSRTGELENVPTVSKPYNLATILRAFEYYRSR